MGGWCSGIYAGFFCLCAARGLAQAAPEEITPREGLVIGRAGQIGRSVERTDAVEARIVAGKWSAPREGDTLAQPDGTTRKWEKISAGKEGFFDSPALRGGGYVYLSVEAKEACVMLLEAQGHSIAYVNGVPFTGDVYGYGYVRLPVALRAGQNDLLLEGGRGGRIKARLTRPRAPITLDTADTTLPDLRIGENRTRWAAVVVINATDKPLTGLTMAAARADVPETRTALPAIPPLSTRKVGFQLRGRTPDAPGPCPVDLTLLRAGEALDKAQITLRVRRPLETYKRTFLSEIDGSVQYYAVNPAQPVGREQGVGNREQGKRSSLCKRKRRRASAGGSSAGATGNSNGLMRAVQSKIQNLKSRIPSPDPAFILTLHGASVEAIGQADAYAAKSWAHLVAPTNRRPYGFSWEEWGRMDGLEVFELARRELPHDPNRVYLTGHSMGGHGTWQFGVTFPDLFAAIGPSAGWITFLSYAGGVRYPNPTPVEAILQRAMSPSDTPALAENLAPLGVYVLHGDADDNVPVTEARLMRDRLIGFHKSFVYYEQPGAGHWWGNSEEPGTACVDWPPMFDLFASRALPDDEMVRDVAFTTMNPGISSQMRWLRIEAQARALQPSTARLRYDPWLRRFTGTTQNVARLSLDLAHVRSGAPLTLDMDGQKIEKIAVPNGAARLWLAREGKEWRAVFSAPSLDQKGPHRCGPFKEAFQHRMLFVYGTQGTPEENDWAYARARYDAQVFWYRGNGAMDIVADTAFRPAAEKDRGVILYGNAETNAAWKALLADSPVQVRRDGVKIGTREEKGSDLACLFLRPRAGSDRACVAVVAGTGIAGMRLTDRQPYFVAGAAYPDCILIGPEMLTKGSAGVRAAGFFGLDWGVETGDFAWR